MRKYPPELGHQSNLTTEPTVWGNCDFFKKHIPMENVMVNMHYFCKLVPKKCFLKTSCLGFAFTTPGPTLSSKKRKTEK